MNSRVIWRTHTTPEAPCKAADTSGILIHAVIPAAVRHNDRTTVLLFVLRLGFNIKSCKGPMENAGLLTGCLSVNPVLSKVEEEMCTGVTVLHNVVH